MPLLLVLSGCWLSGEEIRAKLDGDHVVDDTGDSDSPDDTGDPLGPLALDDISPSFGTAAGGTRVTLTVGPLAGAITVSIGGAQAEVLSVDGHTIIAEAPPGTPGAADVTVTAGERSDTLPGAFTYWVDGTGKQGLLGSVGWYHYNGTYWSSPPVDFGFAWVAAVAPTSMDYAQLFYGTSLDTCKSNYPGAAVSYLPLGASEIDLRTSGGREVSLAHASESDRFERALEAGDFLASGSYGLEPVDGDYWPEFEVDDAVRTPATFSVTHPKLDGAEAVDVSAGNFVLKWTSASVSGDYMGVLLERYKQVLGPTGVETKLQEVVSCTVKDDGEFRVPPEVWKGWDFVGDNQLTIRIGRVQTSSAVLPHNNARSGVVGVYWNIGAVFQGF